MNNPNFSRISKMIPSFSHEIFEDLCLYELLILEWQPYVNLISKTTISSLWYRHIMDSIQLFLFQKEYLNWLDLGSGGGFPAIVLAILLKYQKTGHIILIEKNKRKASFLNRVISVLTLPATVHAKRIEICHELITNSDIITARALAPLHKIFSLVVPFLTENTVLLLQKGKNYQQELDAVTLQWHFDIKTHKSFIDNESVILEIRKIYNLKNK